MDIIRRQVSISVSKANWPSKIFAYLILVAYPYRTVVRR